MNAKERRPNTAGKLPPRHFPETLMSLIIDPAMQSLELTLIGASQRNKALSANMANINTPGYRRVDVDFHAQLARALRVQQATGASQIAAPSFQAAPDQSANAVQQDGNTVDLDQESAMVSENALESAAASQLLALRRRSLELVMKTS